VRLWRRRRPPRGTVRWLLLAAASLALIVSACSGSLDGPTNTTSSTLAPRMLAWQPYDEDGGKPSAPMNEVARTQTAQTSDGRPIDLVVFMAPSTKGGSCDTTTLDNPDFEVPIAPNENALVSCHPKADSTNAIVVMEGKASPAVSPTGYVYGQVSTNIASVRLPDTDPTTPPPVGRVRSLVPDIERSPELSGGSHASRRGCPLQLAMVRQRPAHSCRLRRGLGTAHPASEIRQYHSPPWPGRAGDNRTE